MRILHILDHSIPLHSGYTFRTRAILQQQGRLGWQTYHITSPKQGEVNALKEEVDGLRFFRTPPITGWRAEVPGIDQLAIVSALKKRLEQVVNQVKPDILHAHSPSLNGLAALSVAKRHGLPLVYEIRAFWEDAAVDHGTSTEMGLRYRLTRASETYVIKRADAVTTICEGLRQEIVGRGVAAEKVTVIPNAVDLAKFSQAPTPDKALRAELGLQDKTVLGFLGSFYAYEGLALLIDAMPALLKAKPQVRLLLVGGGPQESLLKQKVEQLGLSQQVIFTGRVPHQDVQRYYGLVDLLVYPRLPMRLTELVTPLKPLEAMAQRKVVAASDVGGHHELIKHGYNGFLFPSGNVDALSSGVIDVLDQVDNWPQVRDNGRDYVETERNWEVSVGRYQSVYPPLLNSALSGA